MDEDLRMKINCAGFCSKDRVLRAAFLLVAAFIVFMLFWGGRQPIAVGLFRAPFDKLAHFAVFVALSLSLWLGLEGSKRPWLVFMLVAAIGGIDELHQFFLPGRQAGWQDFFVDALAAGVVVLLLSKCNSAFHRLAKLFARPG